MNPGRITGLCGRLRCCLAFEHPVYRSFRDRAPAVGRMVDTPPGVASCARTRCPQDALVVRVRASRRTSTCDSTSGRGGVGPLAAAGDRPCGRPARDRALPSSTRCAGGSS